MAVNGKPFAWSYSKLKNFESCPKRHWHVDVAKDIKEEEGDALIWGNQVHKLAAKRLQLGSALPSSGYDVLEKWCQRILTGEGTILVEQRLAITKEFGPCEWFAKEAWYRAVADVVKIHGNVALAIDWKTGQGLEDGVQLALMAACIFAHHPEVQKIRTEFVWLKENGISSREDFDRDSMAVVWRNIWHRIESLEHAHKTTSYPAKPGALCRKWCPVNSCPHHGR
jgi:hypothetical protein